MCRKIAGHYPMLQRITGGCMATSGITAASDVSVTLLAVGDFCYLPWILRINYLLRFHTSLAIKKRKAFQLASFAIILRTPYVKMNNEKHSGPTDRR